MDWKHGDRWQAFFFVSELRLSVFSSWLCGTIQWLSILSCNTWGKGLDRIIEKTFPSFGLSNGDWLVFYGLICAGYFPAWIVFYALLNAGLPRAMLIALFGVSTFGLWYYVATGYLDFGRLGALTQGSIAAVVSSALVRSRESSS